MVNQTSPVAARLSDARFKPSWLIAIACLATILVLKLAVAATLNLRSDEAYVWVWSQEAALSFLDHPPMIAYFARLGTAVFGQNLLGVRLPGFVGLALAELLLADIVRRRTGSLGTAFAVILAMEATVYFGVTGAILEPSLPMILFISLMFWGLCRLEETDDGRWWMLVGVAGGLALLSKYIALLFVPAVVVFIVLPRHNRKWLATIWPWLAVLLALAVFSPVLWWNSQHDWASFRFQGVRVTGTRGFDLSRLLSFASISVVAIGPLLAPLAALGAIVAGWRAFRRGDGTILALASGFLVVLAYLTVRSLTLTINTTWPVAMWPFGIAAAATVLAAPDVVRTSRWLKGAAVAAVLTSLPVLALFDYHHVFNRASQGGRLDPVGRDDGYDHLAGEVLAEARAIGAQWIATSDRRTAAQLRWFLGKDLPVVQLNERSRYIDFAVPNVAGKTGLYVHIKGQRVAAIDAVAESHLSPLGEAERVWRNKAFQTYEIERIDNFAPELDPPPGGPLYAWPDLVSAASGN